MPIIKLGRCQYWNNRWRGAGALAFKIILLFILIN